MDVTVQPYQMFINGELVPSENKATYEVINPATTEVIAKVPKCDGKDAGKAVDAAREAFDKGRWPRIAPAERAGLIMKLADIVEKEIDSLALLETQQPLHLRRLH